MAVNFEKKEKFIWFCVTKIITFVLVVAIYSLMIIGAYRVDAKVQSDKKETNSKTELISLWDHNVNYKDVNMTIEDFVFDDIGPAEYAKYYGKPLYDSVDIISEDISDSLQANDMSDSDIVEDSEDIQDVEDDLEYIEEPETDDITDEEQSDIIKPNKDDWRLVLINKQNPVPDDYEMVLDNIDSSHQADERIIDSINKMLEASRNDGVNLNICSAYRSYERQITLFNNKMNKLMKQGMNYMDAYTVGSMSVTVPGTSEHQIGLALDILSNSYYEMDDGFGDTPEGIWLKDNAPDYGFILRYPQGKEDITGIIYEPWHFRYVGEEYARQITDLGICLEEYLNGDY